MNEKQLHSLSPLGDSAILINFGNAIDETINKRVLALFELLKQSAIKGVRDIVPAYCSLVIHYDPLIKKVTNNITAFEFYSQQINHLLNSENQLTIKSSRSVKVPVCYSTKYALDITNIATERKIPVDEIIQLHCAGKYRVYMIGFLPGFAYMGEVDERIAMPRLSQPRLRIEAGSVGIADKQTGIYPVASPGGWQIIGKTPLSIFNKDAEDPIFFQPGDEVQFYSITEDEFENY